MEVLLSLRCPLVPVSPSLSLVEVGERSAEAKPLVFCRAGELDRLIGMLGDARASTEVGL